VVVSNFGWKAADWPEATQQALEQFVSRGGGFVSVHAANNSFPGWKAYNRLIGLGGWGDRSEKDGPYVYYNAAGKLVRDPSPGRAGSHGPQHEYVLEARTPDHPILRGLPRRWRHTQDECYDRLRGPAENLTVLATAYSSPEHKGTGRHEPALMVVEFGRGRVFHTILGHEDYSFESVGFITTLLRGTEWAATGRVTLPVPSISRPKTRPSAGRSVSRKGQPRSGKRLSGRQTIAGAGGRNRTDETCLEGRSFTTKLRPQGASA
jgi:type 1 glutamine amidotransferase